MPDSPDRLAVCSWSLQPDDCDDLIEKVRAVGINRVQLHIDPIALGQPGWDGAVGKLKSAGVQLVSGMVGCVGEDYSSIAAIHRTGGVVPDDTWPKSRERFVKGAEVAGAAGVPLVTFHAGFVPADPADPAFATVRDRLAAAGAIFAAAGADLALETGQESADALLKLLGALGPHVGVNFDPANMILYGSGDPTDALRKLVGRVKQVHLKDAVPSGNPGVDWGREAALGEGRVDWPAFFATLRQGGFAGNYVIEREDGEQRVADVRTAVRVYGEQGSNAGGVERC